MDYAAYAKNLIAKMNELEINRINPALAMALIGTSSPSIAKATLELLVVKGVLRKDGKDYVFENGK